jgi:hypothetical protein
MRALIDRFAAAGPAGCTTHPHAFFGRLTPDEWAILPYKRLDHHLRQFGVSAGEGRYCRKSAISTSVPGETSGILW